jgi:hypothetical protein
MHLDNYDDFGKSLDQWRYHFKEKKMSFRRNPYVISTSLPVISTSLPVISTSRPVISTEGRNLHASSRQPRFKISPALRPFEMTKLLGGRSK